MFVSVNKLANKLPKDKPDNRAANALQEGLGGQFGEMCTMMQYLFQNFNFRGKAKPYQDLIKSVAGEEIGHVEVISTTINMLLEGTTENAPPNEIPLAPALDAAEHTSLPRRRTERYAGRLCRKSLVRIICI